MIIIHGTDTLEITSYFLYRCIYVENKPIILTGSSRINSSHNFDGNANITNSIKQALNPECSKYAEGVTINFAGKIHSPAYIHKEHSFALGLTGLRKKRSDLLVIIIFFSFSRSVF